MLHPIGGLLFNLFPASFPPKQEHRTCPGAPLLALLEPLRLQEAAAGRKRRRGSGRFATIKRSWEAPEESAFG